MAISDSQMAMWETIVALVHVDGKIHQDEDKFLQDRFEKLPVTPQQKEELLNQLHHPGSPKELFKKISEPKDRSQVIYFARLLFYSDGDFSAEEKLILDHLHSEAMAKVDIKKVMHEIDQVMIDFKNQEQARREAQPMHRRAINALIFWADLDHLD